MYISNERFLGCWSMVMKGIYAIVGSQRHVCAAREIVLLHIKSHIWPLNRSAVCLAIA